MTGVAVEIPQNEIIDNSPLDLLTQPSGLSRVAEYHTYVNQHAEALVESKHAPGLKAPLGLLVNMCPVEVTEENVDMFFSEARDMVTQSEQEHTAEIEELKTEDETEEVVASEEDTADGEIKEKQPEMALMSDRQEKSAPSEQIENTQGASPAEITVQPEPATAYNPKADTSSSGSMHSVMKTKSVSAETQKKIPKLRFEADNVRRKANSKLTEKSGTTSKTLIPAAKEPEAPGASMLKQGTAEIVNGVETARAVHEISQAGPAQEDESRQLPDLVAVEPEKVCLETGANDDPETESRLSESAAPVSDSTAGGYIADEERGDFDFTRELPLSREWGEDQEINIITTEKPYLRGILQADIAESVRAYEQVEETETIFELSLPVEKVEQAVQELAERIENLEDDETLAVHEILDKIVAMSRIIPPAADGSQEQVVTMPNSAEVQISAVRVEEYKEEELKELFIELFDRVEMDYTPEILESFIKLAVHGNIAEVAEAIESDEKEEAMADRGTHEAITQLLAAISRIKKAVLHAYRIGKSMLQLYSRQLATT